ncbi:hypothetical protein ACFL96_14395 [Thermoproteota archaeon]
MATCLAIITLILYSAITAADQPVVDIAPTEMYETTAHTFNLTINNYNGDYEITSVKVVSANLEIQSLADYIGWSENFSSSFAHWYDGSIATNVLLALFQLNAQAAQVDENQSEIIYIIITDPEDHEHEYQVPFTIINDDTAPEVSNPVPQDGDHLQEGTDDQLVSIDAVDPETGIKTVGFSWTLCDQGNDTNNTPPSYDIELTQFEDTASYSAIIDISEYENEEEVCFGFTAENNGGEIVELEGSFLIDGEAPEVTLDHPEEGGMMNAESEFLFTATDNLADTLECGFYNDEVLMLNVTAENGVQQTVLAVDAEEGVHDWKVVCQDRAGWDTESETRMYILDKTPPEIELISPANNSVISFMTLIHFNTSDNYQLEQVYFVLEGTRYDVSSQFSIDPLEWLEGPTAVTVVVEDAAGNMRTEEYVFIVDRTAPTVDLISPENQSDVHVTFEFELDDNYDPTLECALVVDNQTRQEGIFNTSEIGEFVDLLMIGNHTWYVMCTDDANNTGFSGIDTLVVIDTSGPDMEFNHATTYFRGETIYFNVTITDPSDVEVVDATLELPDSGIMEVFLLERDGDYVQDLETTVNFSLGTYVLDVYTEDSLGHSTRNQSDILLTYRYVVDLDLSSSSIELGESVTATGNVLFDNGSYVPEDTVTLHLPTGSVEAALGEDGSFEYMFTPNETGTYDILAEITPENGVLFTDSEELIVSAVPPEDDEGDDNGEGSGASGTRIRDTTHSSGSCSPDWDCGEWSECSNRNKYRTCTQMNCGDTKATKTVRRACHEEIEPEETLEKPEPEPQPRVTSNSLFVNDTVDEEPVVTKDNEGDGLFGRIGRAFGFLTGAGAGLSLFIVVLLALALVAVLFLTGWTPSKKERDELFGDYFDRRK